MAQLLVMERLTTMMINKIGAAIFHYELEFNKAAASQGLMNPFEEEDAFFREHIKGDHECWGIDLQDLEKLDRAELRKRKTEWIAKRKEYVTQKLFEQFGYDVAAKYAEKDLNRLPCSGADGQCNFNCSIYSQCQQT